MSKLSQQSPPTLEYHRPDPPLRPVALTVVAWLFIGFGILAAVQMIVALFNGRISFELGILDIFIGRGLLRFSPGWRTCGLVMLWLGMIGVPLLLIMMLMSNVPANVTINGRIVSGNSSRQIVAAGAMIWTLVSWVGCIWCYRVLIRNDVRRLFGL